VTIEQLRWSRIHVDGEETPEGHAHSFFRDGNDKRIVKVEVCMRNNFWMTMLLTFGLFFFHFQLS